MKKLVFLFIAATLLVALLPAVASATGDDGDDHDYCTRLTAGGGNPKSAIKVGWVCVDEVNEGLKISYQTSLGWCMTETHLHVFYDPFNDVPHKNGNPIPGHFDYSTMNQCAKDVVHIVPFDAAPAYIAAHAVVCKCDCGDKCADTKCDCSYECECSDECETAWGGDYFGNPMEFPGRNWAIYFMYPAE